MSEPTVDWLFLVSYPVDKIPFHFLGDFHQQLSQLSSIGHMSPWAVGCLLDVSFESVGTEFRRAQVVLSSLVLSSIFCNGGCSPFAPGMECGSRK